MEAIPDKKATDSPLTSAEIRRDYCNQLFKVVESLKDLTPEERFCKRLELKKPILEAFWCWLESLNVLKGSALGKAVTYAMNQRPFMENYLLDGRCAISNNAAENAIRPFTVGRKNWLFADAQRVHLHQRLYIVLLRLRKQTVSMYLHILIIYFCTCQIQTGRIISKNWMI